ncbi:MAG: FMN-binding negative transcriptional regulator [Acidobacteriaceae bacterium]|nr:FMN-binding negative transcriptional regulator [Acidobacteriaceae bacterium]
MYTPTFNQVADRAVLLDAMRQNAFALLLGPFPGADPAAAPVATHLPLVIRDEGPHGVLEGHFAHANAQWSALAGRETLVIFNGPHGYVSPALYEEELSVPTWNYISVHAWGALETIEDEDAKDALLKRLIAEHEPAFAGRWRAMPAGFRRSMLAGLVGFRIPIARIEGKFKLSQNRSQADRDKVRSAHAVGTAAERELAQWMQRLGV